MSGKKVVVCPKTYTSISLSFGLATMYIDKVNP